MKLHRARCRVRHVVSVWWFGGCGLLVLVLLVLLLLLLVLLVLLLLLLLLLERPPRETGARRPRTCDVDGLQVHSAVINIHILRGV